MTTTADKLGYWSSSTPPYFTASENWCEPNYLHSFYIAEWYNTLSSVPIFLTALYGLITGLRNNYYPQLLVPYALMSLVGLGSVAFHGTLRREGQALDELPMMYASSSLLYCALATNMEKKKPLLFTGLILYCILTTVVYFTLHQFFIYFLLAYAVSVVLLFLAFVNLLPKVKDSRVKWLLGLSALFYLFGFFFLWVPDKLLCDRVQNFSFHAWFHLTSTVGPHCLLTYSAYATHFINIKDKTRQPRLQFQMGLVPYVTLGTVKSV